MLQQFFRYLFLLAVKGYFRTIYVKGKEHVPSKGPVIFCPNHTSAFMDPILVGIMTPRSHYFLTRGDIFKSRLISTLFGLFHMIPIYKEEDSPDKFHENTNIFRKCFEHLAKHKTIMIFPEGTSKTERRLRPIKTGTARIAFGAEEEKNFELGVKIIPVGINYSNPHNFRSDVFLNIGQPIDVKDYKEEFQKDNWEAVKSLTERIKTELESLLVIVEDEQLDHLIQDIEVLYRSKLREELGKGEKPAQDFYLSKDIVKAVEFHLKQNPERLREFEYKIEAYLSNLRKLKIKDTQVRSAKISLNLIMQATYFILGFPFFPFGFLINFLPFQFVAWISRTFEIREDFLGSIKLAGGAFSFLIFYGILLGLVIKALGWWFGLGFVTLLYPIGLFTIQYLRNWYQVRGTMKYIRLFMRKSDLIANLKVRRQELVDELERGREEYLNSVN